MFRISTHRKDQARFLRVALTVIIATMMVISSMMPAYYSFAEDEAKEETKTQTTVETKAEEPKKEEPKKEAPPAKTQEPVQASDDQTPSGGSDQEEVQDPDPEPKAT